MKVAKKLYFDLPGFGRVHAMPGGEFSPEGFNREFKKSDAGVVGYTEEPETAKVKFKVAKKPGLSQRTLSDMTDVNITITSDDGDVFVVRGCVTTGPVSLSDGDFDVEMEGIAVEEVS